MKNKHHTAFPFPAIPALLCLLGGWLWAGLLHSVAQSLNIAEALEQAERNPAYQQRILETDIRREALAEIRRGRVPVFYADANLHRNLIIPTTPVPAIAFDPDAEEGAVIPLKFATRWSAKAALQLEWLLFDPQRGADEREASMEIRKADIQQAQTLRQTRRDVALAYTAVVLATHQYESARRDSAAYEEIEATTRARFEAGRGSHADFLRAQQRMEESRIRLSEAWSVLLEADLELRRYVDLQGKQTLSTDTAALLTFARTLGPDEYGLQLLEIDQEIATLREQRLRQGLLPSFSLNASLGEQYYSNELQLTRREEWFGNSFVTLSLRIPLSDYLTSVPSFRKARTETALASKKVEQELRELAIDRQQAAVRIRHAEERLERLRRIEALSTAAMEEQAVAYRAGRRLWSDYHESIVELNQAKQAVWQATYDLMAELMEVR